MDVSVIYENEKQSQKEARSNADETRKRCLESFAETSRKTTETNNDDDRKKKKRTRQSGSETINYLRERAEKDLELKKEENNIKQVQEERLTVFSHNQFQLFGRVINDQREQMQKVVDSLQTLHRSIRLEVFCKKGVLKNTTKFMRKHLCQRCFP